MSKTEARTGLTNILKRFAYYCLFKYGLGQHELKDNAYYDTVDIQELYPWVSNPENPSEYGGGISVAFFKNNEKIRFVEFAIRFTGGGGQDIIRRIK